MAKPKPLLPSRVVGKAWVGVWASGHLGFIGPRFISGGTQRDGLDELQSQVIAGKGGFMHSDFYRVRVILEPLKDKRGRFIVKRSKVKA